MEETSNLKNEEQLLSLTDWCAAKMVLTHRENSDIKKSMLIMVDKENDGYVIMHFRKITCFRSQLER